MKRLASFAGRAAAISIALSLGSPASSYAMCQVLAVHADGSNEIILESPGRGILQITFADEGALGRLPDKFKRLLYNRALALTFDEAVEKLRDASWVNESVVVNLVVRARPGKVPTIDTEFPELNFGPLPLDKSFDLIELEYLVTYAIMMKKAKKEEVPLLVYLAVIDMISKRNFIYNEFAKHVPESLRALRRLDRLRGFSTERNLMDYYRFRKYAHDLKNAMSTLPPQPIRLQILTNRGAQNDKEREELKMLRKHYRELVKRSNNKEAVDFIIADLIRAESRRYEKQQ